MKLFFLSLIEKIINRKDGLVEIESLELQNKLIGQKLNDCDIQ